MSKNRLDYTANLGRHSHDVTAGFTSSLTTGAIVPQYFDILGPSDKIYFKTHMFCRFQNIATAFLGEVDLHIDYFFVPLQMLYTAFGQVFAQTSDVISDFYGEYDTTSPDLLPVADLNSLFENGNFYTHLIETFNPYCREDLAKGCFRLLDSLNINPMLLGRSFDPATWPVLFPTVAFTGFPAALLAYQAIYQKYFRNEELERFDISSFNVDSAALSADKKISNSQLEKILTLRFSGRPNDYFTSVRFSPIATSINSLNSFASISNIDGGRAVGFGDLFKKVSNFLHTNNESYSPQGINSALGDGPEYSNRLLGVSSKQEVDDDSRDYLSAQNIRAVFALDKYMRVYGRAGKTYDDQILAHFGVKVPHDIKHDLTHIKHYRMVLQSDPVVSTADTSEGSVGNIGGQLAAQLDTDEVSFTAPVHGVFMCVARLVPHPRYFLTNDRLHAISERISFPIPEFDKLGAQPVYSLEYGGGPQSNFVLWKNRYSEFKEKYNRCSITFAHDVNHEQGVNFFSPWVVSKLAFNAGIVGGGAIDPDFRDFFVQPNDLDNVMVTKYNLNFPGYSFGESPHIVLQTDPVLTEFACFAKKVSWMSPTGEPDL